MGNKTNFTPVEIGENEKEIMKIAERAQKLLLEQHGVDITHAVGIPTIARAFLLCAINFVNERKAPDTDYILNLMGLLDIGVSHRSGSEDAEKEGNYVPIATPGPEFKLIVKDDNETEE